MRTPPLKALLNVWTALIVAVLVANIAAFALWTLPRWGAHLGTSGTTGRIESARARIEPRLRLARDSYGRLVSAEADLRSFRAELVAAAGGSDLMAMLVQAGANAGLIVEDANFQFAAVEELGVVQVGIDLPLIGSYHAARAFFDELGALPVFLVIDGVGLQVVGGSATRPPSGARGAIESVRVDLALSVFLDDPELSAAAAVAGTAAAVAPRRSARASADEARLLAAASGDDPEELVDALVARLESFPPLTVDPDALVLHLAWLDRPTVTTDPQRNLFSVVLPPAPAPNVSEVPEVFVEPEPLLPVQLLGVAMVEGRWHASLMTDNDGLFVAESGDRLPNGVEVIEVGADYVDVMYADERTRLSLEGNE